MSLDDIVSSAVSKALAVFAENFSEMINERLQAVEERIDSHDEHLQSLDRIVSNRYSYLDTSSIGADVRADISVAKREPPFRFYFQRAYGMEYTEAEDFLRQYRRFDEVINAFVDARNMVEFRDDPRTEKIREFYDEVMRKLAEEWRRGRDVDEKLDEMRRLFNKILSDYREGRFRWMAKAAAMACEEEEEANRLEGEATREAKRVKAESRSSKKGVLLDF